MSAIDSGSSRSRGLTLNSEKKPKAAVGPNQSQLNKTLLDIIRDEEPQGSLFGHKDKKSWKAFRDRLRLKRAGAAWTSSVHIPASDIPIRNNNRNMSSRSLMARRNSVRFTTASSVDSGEDDFSGPRPQMSRRSSTRFGPICSVQTDVDDSSVNVHAVEDGPPARSFRPQILRHNSTRYPIHDEDGEEQEDGVGHEGARHVPLGFGEERVLSAREAVAAQEAAEAGRAAREREAAEAERKAKEEAESNAADKEDAEADEEAQTVRMSLMDLLEETDRQMGVVGSSYMVGEDGDEDGDEEYNDDDEGEFDDGAEESGGVEHTCCVCMVRHKGAAFVPCGHTFCRLCSRELWVQRGHCPLCNAYILEILDIF